MEEEQKKKEAWSELIEKKLNLVQSSKVSLDISDLDDNVAILAGEITFLLWEEHNQTRTNIFALFYSEIHFRSLVVVITSTVNVISFIRQTILMLW